MATELNNAQEAQEPKAPVVNYGFDNDDFGDEIDQAAKGGFGGGGTYATFKATPGNLVKYAKAGVFEETMPDPEDPKKTIKDVYPSFDGVIIDSSFNREYWIKDENNKNKVLCQTVKHRKKNDPENPDEYTGNGKWQTPYGEKITIERYDPIGSRGKRCAECIACGEHGKPAGVYGGETGCRQAGHLIAGKTAFTMRDPKTKKPVKTPLDEPVLLNLQTPPTSGISFQKYGVELSKNGFRPNQVITTFKTKPTESGNTNVLDLFKGDPVDPAVFKQLWTLYMDEINRIEEERKKKAEERRNASGQGNSAKGKTTKTAEPEEEEEINFELPEEA